MLRCMTIARHAALVPDAVTARMRSSPSRRSLFPPARIAILIGFWVFGCVRRTHKDNRGTNDTTPKPIHAQG